MHRLLILPFLLLPCPALAAGTDADVRTLRTCLESAGDDAESCVAIISNPCQEGPGGTSNTGMNACMDRETAAWDAILNQNYAATQSLAKTTDADRKDGGDTEANAARTLREAQRAWIAYRDAECARRYEFYKEGTIRLTVAAACLLELTADRAIALDEQN